MSQKSAMKGSLCYQDVKLLQEALAEDTGFDIKHLYTIKPFHFFWWFVISVTSSMNPWNMLAFVQGDFGTRACIVSMEKSMDFACI